MSNGSDRKGAVQLALEQMMFGKFTTRERVVSVATTAAVLLKNNPERMGYILTNTGNIQITFKISQDVTAGKGIILNQLGDTLSTTFTEDGAFPTHELSAIANASGGELYVLEIMRYSV